MFKDIERAVAQCDVCLKARLARINSKYKIITSRTPNQLWECDIIGRLPEANGGYKIIFTAIDHYTSG
ncbi:hypothetical protein ENBRE01_2826 [Enteropsectra breve]|nr:hypothetical protein ENBRE01_2826 [Enteropsectra breve]